jgi:hypothetical protein
MCENWSFYFLGENLTKKENISSNIGQFVTFLILGNLKSILGNPIDLVSWQFSIIDMEFKTWQCATDNLLNLMIDDLKQIGLGKLMKWMSLW